ncbi:hypothetical protein D3C87_1601610 [compost metagenome]
MTQSSLDGELCEACNGQRLAVRHRQGGTVDHKAECVFDFIAVSAADKRWRRTSCRREAFRRVAEIREGCVQRMDLHDVDIRRHRSFSAIGITEAGDVGAVAHPARGRVARGRHHDGVRRERKTVSNGNRQIPVRRG